MKNFSDATAIKPSLTLDIVLRVKPVGTVLTHLKINESTWTTTIVKEEVFKHKVGITNTVNIQIQIERTHPEALAVDLEIDGNKILPLYQEQLGVNSYIDSNDIWSITIPNFYSWLHKITGQGWII